MPCSTREPATGRLTSRWAPQSNTCAGASACGQRGRTCDSSRATSRPVSGRRIRRCSRRDCAPRYPAIPVTWWHSTARPFFRMATNLAIAGSLQHERRGTDVVEYVDGQAPVAGADINDLTIGTAWSATRIGIGLSYSHDGMGREGVLRMPVEASFSVERTVAGSKRAGGGTDDIPRAVQGLQGDRTAVGSLSAGRGANPRVCVPPRRPHRPACVRVR